MDFEYKIQSLERNIKENEANILSLKDQFNKAKTFTSKFLDTCSEYGITKVSISKSDKSIPSSMNYPFSASGSVFAFQPKKVNSNSGWPPIWGVVKKLGISGGCGNSDQHQADTSNLIDGVYHLKSGKWQRVS